MQIIKYVFQPHGDERGQLVALEEFRDIPFQIKRVYYMYNTKELVARGFHAHKKLNQVLICVSGSCTVILDDGNEKETVLLDSPNLGLSVPCKIWHEMHNFSSNAVLMVLASELYEESDYIRDYDEFLKYIQSEEPK